MQGGWIRNAGIWWSDSQVFLIPASYLRCDPSFFFFKLIVTSWWSAGFDAHSAHNRMYSIISNALSKLIRLGSQIKNYFLIHLAASVRII